MSRSSLSHPIERLCAFALLWLAVAAGAAVAQPTTLATPSARSGKSATSPTWSELSPGQRDALAPLASHWHTIDQARKRKWLALAENFARLPAAEQARMHSRMTEWATLSPQQRTEARLNFAEAQQLSSDERKAKWEAYQALPPEEKRKLARSAAPRTPLPAAAVKPVPADKLATVPRFAPDAKPARISVAPPPEPAGMPRPVAPALPTAPAADPAAPASH